ncbi:Bifunctional pinoresinol-lariciresinol reductase [Capsicum annuum]|uniref:(+)-lariciresinol reductase n=1 Tax=Capsicum annuum TaxID=4072 RepID=A0A2G3AFU4_CAPAN|nr:Bifunctional pinoresinol-lariciresinol reductase [Capsicum annuum]
MLIVGGTGFLGKRLVKASLENGHDTYILQRPEIALDIDKIQMLISFKMQGAHLVHASFNDHRSLVDAVKLVDVVICAISGVYGRSHQILLQLKLVEAIKEAGNIKRFLPSEFGSDSARMGDALEPGRITFDDKMVVRKAIGEANIPFTYVVANCFACYFLAGLCQLFQFLPARDSVVFLGDANQKGMKYHSLRIIHKQLSKRRQPMKILRVKTFIYCAKKNFYAVSFNSCTSIMYIYQVGLGHYYNVCYEGCLANFEIGEDEEEASKLYPEVNYTTAEDYLKRYV